MLSFIKPTSRSIRFNDLLARLPLLQIPLDNPTQQFLKFSNLPKEIKIKIWKVIAHQRRSIKLVANTLQLHADHRSHSIQHQRRVPAILHICQESRKEGLIYYDACREYTPWDVGLSSNDTPWFSATYSNTIYVCFKASLLHRSKFKC
jgi:2EXR family